LNTLQEESSVLKIQSNLEETDFPHEFLDSCYALLDLTFIYCKCKYISLDKKFLLMMLTQCVTRLVVNILLLFFKYLTTRKLFQVKVVEN